MNYESKLIIIKILNREQGFSQIFVQNIVYWSNFLDRHLEHSTDNQIGGRNDR